LEAFKEEIDAPNGRKIALEMAYMLPVWTPAQTRSTSGKKRVFFRRKVEWLFNQAHFPLGFEIGRTLRLRLIIMLAVNCAAFLQQEDRLPVYKIAEPRPRGALVPARCLALSAVFLQAIKDLTNTLAVYS